MFTVEWDEASKTEGGSATRRKAFEVESDARRFARSLRSDVWTYRSCVCLYREGERIAAGFDEHKPL